MLLYLSIHKETKDIMAVNTSFVVRPDSDLHIVESDETNPTVIYNMKFIQTDEPLNDEKWFNREFVPLEPSGYLE